MEDIELKETLLLFYRALSQDASAVEKILSVEGEISQEQFRKYFEERKRALGQILSYVRRKYDLKNPKLKHKRIVEVLDKPVLKSEEKGLGKADKNVEKPTPETKIEKTIEVKSTDKKEEK